MSERVDLIKLKATCNQETWNKYLTRCHKGHEIQELTDMYQRLQRGMAHLVKEKMNTEDMQMFFIRLSRSVEKTMKQIFREKKQSEINYDVLDKSKSASQLTLKRQADQEFEAYLRKVSY